MNTYVTIDDWTPLKSEFPAAALSSYLYPPHVSCVQLMSSWSPRVGEASPNAQSRKGVFLTQPGSQRMLTRSTASGTNASSKKSTLPSSYEQQKSRCRWWHHEFHRLLEDEVKAVHQRQMRRHASRLSAQSSSSSTGPTVDPALPPVTTPPQVSSPSLNMDHSDIPLVGEDTVQQQLAQSIFQQFPVPLAQHGSVLPSAVKSTLHLPGLMSTQMSQFLEEFEATCVEGAKAVLQYATRLQNVSSAPGSPASPSNRSEASLGNGTSRYFVDPFAVRPLEDSRGLDTSNFFVYRHLVYNVLHLVDENVMELFGCVEHLEKVAAAEVRGLQCIVQAAITKGSLSLSTIAGAAAKDGSGTAGNSATLSVPLVCLVRYRGVAMFVIAQPASTPMESVVSGPSCDGLHIPSTMRHTSLLNTLSAQLRVPNSSFFITESHKRLMSQCPALGHPELTVVLANKIPRDLEQQLQGEVTQLEAYSMPHLHPSKLRQLLASKRPTNHMSRDEDDDGEDLTTSQDIVDVAHQSSDVLIVSNVARFVTPPADVSLTTLVPHILTPQKPTCGSKMIAGIITSPRQRQQQLVAEGRNNREDRTPLCGTTPPRSVESLALVTRNILSSPMAPPGGVTTGNRYLEIGHGASLYSLLHFNLILTLPYETEVPRSALQSAAAFETEVRSATHRCLTSQMDKFVEWLCGYLDACPNICQFVESFDGTVLKMLMHAWGINLRYLGQLHRRLCEWVVAKAPTAYSTTRAALEAAAQAVAAAHAKMINSAISSMAFASTLMATSKAPAASRRQLRRLEASNTAAPAAASASSPAAAANASGPPASTAANSTQKPGGRMFLNQFAPLDAASSLEIAANVRDTVRALNGLLAAELECDTPSVQPPPPAAPVTALGTSGHHSMRRASVLTSGGASSISAALAHLTAPAAGGPTNSAATSTVEPPPSEATAAAAVRCPSQRSPIEHLLLTLRCEMISRAARIVIMEHLRSNALNTDAASTASAAGTNPPSASLPSLPKPPGAKKHDVLSQWGGVTDSGRVDSFAVTPRGAGAALLTVPETANHLQPVKLSIVTVGPAPTAPQHQQSNSARLYQRLKDLSAILSEKNAMALHHSDESLTVRSLDRIVAMSGATKESSSKEGTGQHHATSVLRSDPNPQYEPDGLFNTRLADPEKEKVAELLSLIVANGTTAVSKLFWQHVMFSEIWSKFSSVGGGAAAAGYTPKRTDIQRADMVQVLERVCALCGIQLGEKAVHMIAAADGVGESSLNKSVMSQGGIDRQAPLARSIRRAITTPLTHNDVVGLTPVTRSTLRRVPLHSSSRKKQPDKAPLLDRYRLEVGTLSGSHHVLFPAKVAQLEKELKDLQLHRFVKKGKKYKEGLGDATTLREIAVLDALLRLYHHGGSQHLADAQLAAAQKANAELVVFYHALLALWQRVGFDGICYSPCGSCGVLYNATVSDVHRCGNTSTKIDMEELSVGIGDGKLPSALIEASSSLPGHYAHFSRKVVTASSWRPNEAVEAQQSNGDGVPVEPFIEFSFSTNREVVAIEIQGDGVSRYVRSFQLVYALDFQKPEIFTGVYYHRDANENFGAMNGGKGEQLLAKPFVFGCSVDRTLALQSPSSFRATRHPSSNSNPASDAHLSLRGGAQQTQELRSPTTKDDTFASIAWTASMRTKDFTANTAASGVFTPDRTVHMTDANKHSKASLGTSTTHTSLRATFLKGNSDAKSVTRIQFAEPFRCSKLRLNVGNEDIDSAALKIDIFYTSRHMPAPGRGGTERIAVNHVSWDSSLTLSNFADSGSARTMSAFTNHQTMKMTRRELAVKEKDLLERILVIESEIIDSSTERKLHVLPHEMWLIRSSTELPALRTQLLQLLLMWGIERSSDVQLAQFALLRYFLGEVKLLARCGQTDLAESKADRLMKRLDDAVGPLGFGGVALLVGPLMYLIKDALECVGVLARHISDFEKMVRWASEVRHPLIVQILAVLIDAAGHGTTAEREGVAQLCQELAKEGRLDSILKAPPASQLQKNAAKTQDSIESGVKSKFNVKEVDQAGEPLVLSSNAARVFEKLREMEMFLALANDDTQKTLYPRDPDYVRSMREQEAQLLQ